MVQNFKLPRFAKDGLYNLSRQILSLVLGLITSIIVARSLGVEARGVYAVLVLIPTILLIFFNSGVQVAIIYHVARAERDLGEMIRSNVALTTWLSLLGTGVGGILILLTRHLLFQDIGTPLLLISLFILPISMYKDNLNAVFRGLQDFRSFNLIEIAPQVGIFALTIVFVGVLHMGIAGAVAAILGGRIIGLVMALWLLRKDHMPPKLLSLSVNRPYARELFQHGKYVYISNISAFLNYRVDIVMLTLLSTSRSVGIYDVAVTLVERLWSLSDALSLVLLPRIASLSQDNARRQSLTPLVTRYLFWINVIVGILLSVFAEWFILLVYGAEFRESATALRLLTPGIVTWGMATILAQDVTGRGKPQLNAAAAVAAAVLNFSINLLLIPMWDYNGAAVTTTLSYTAYALILGWSFCRLTGIDWRTLVVPTQEDRQHLKAVLHWGIGKLLRRNA